MEIAVKILLPLHVLFGFISLVLFWLPVFLKKGGKGHRVVGKMYVAAMWIVVSTAVLLCIKNAIIGKYQMAAFLGFISLITGNTLWFGIAILRPAAQASNVFKRIHITMDVLVVTSGILLLSYGIFLQGQGSAVLMIVFGILGLTDLPSLVRKLRNMEKELDRIKEHMIGLLTSGIAAYTAFFVFGGYTWMEKILPGMWGIIPWVAPGLLGGLGITFGVKYFRKRGMIAEQV
jgi:hypothetical protein